jgi:hypothetical protein
MTVSLTAKIEQLHVSLRAADLPHAFGGALALAFCIEEPRTTQDIDLNVFIGVERAGELVDALPSAVIVNATNRDELARDAQSRAWWDRTPVDLFLSNHPFHDRAEANRRTVQFAGVERLPVLACADLAVFKAFYARPKDAVDVAAMVDAGAVDLAALEYTVEGLLDEDERRQFFNRVREFVADQGSAPRRLR